MLQPLFAAEELWVQEQHQNAPRVSEIYSCSKPIMTEQGLDIGAMVDRFSTLGHAKPMLTSDKPAILAFVSFSMPKQSLRLLSEQLSKIGGTLVLRGLVENSISKTVAKTIELFGDKEVGGFSVDPEAFKQHQVRAVPAVVIIPKKSCKKEPCQSEFDIVYGDVPLEESLERFSKSGSPAVKEAAQDFLKLYRSNADG